MPDEGAWWEWLVALAAAIVVLGNAASVLQRLGLIPLSWMRWAQAKLAKNRVRDEQLDALADKSNEILGLLKPNDGTSLRDELMAQINRVSDELRVHIDSATEQATRANHAASAAERQGREIVSRLDELVSTDG